MTTPQNADVFVSTGMATAPSAQCCVHMYLSHELLRDYPSSSLANLDAEAIRAAEEERPDLTGSLVVRQIHAVRPSHGFSGMFGDVVHLMAVVESIAERAE